MGAQNRLGAFNVADYEVAAFVKAALLNPKLRIFGFHKLDKPGLLCLRFANLVLFKDLF